MKKILAALVASALLMSGTAFAGQIDAGKILAATSSANVAGGVVTVNQFAKLSAGVSMGYAIDAASYAIATKHTAGTNSYGAASNDGKTYMLVGSTGTAAADITASDSSAFSTWSPM